METATSFGSLLIVISTAAVVPLVLSRFKRMSVPVVVGEIIAGIILGRSVLSLVITEEPVLHFLSELGLVFLMFLSGMEIDFSSLGLFNQSGSDNQKKKKDRLGPLQLGLIIFGGTLILAILSGFGLVHLNLVKDPWMMGLILSTTSLGVVVPVLKEKGMIGGKYGQTLLIAALLADFATMLLITIEVAILSFGLTFDILLVLLLFVFAIAIYRFNRFFFNKNPWVRRAMEEYSSATTQIKVRLSIAIMLVFVVLAELLGTEVILGSFLAGAMISLLMTSSDSKVPEQLETVGYGFIIPIFFIMVGVELNFTALFSSTKAMLLVPLLLVAAFLVKILPSLLLKLRFSLKESIAGGVLLSSRLSLIIAAVAIGTRLNVITEEVNAAIILVAVITVTVSPMIFTRLFPKSEEKNQQWIVIAGAGFLARQVGERLKKHHEPVVLIARDEENTEESQKAGLNVIKGKIEEHDEAVLPYLQKAHTILVTHSTVDSNYEISRTAKEYGIKHVISYLQDPNDIPRFLELGVRVVNLPSERVPLLTTLTRNPGLYELLTSENDDKEIIEVHIDNKVCLDRRLKDLELPGDVLVLAIRRNGELLVPHGSTRLKMKDEITLLGSLDCVETARQILTGPC